MTYIKFTLRRTPAAERVNRSASEIWAGVGEYFFIPRLGFSLFSCLFGQGAAIRVCHVIAPEAFDEGVDFIGQGFAKPAEIVIIHVPTERVFDLVGHFFQAVCE